MNPLKSLLLLMMVLIVAVPASAETWGHDRDGFVLGFNIGGGSSSFKPDDGLEESGGGGAGSFRVGWAFANQFLVGIESTAWVGDTDLGADITLYSNKVNFTWYPGAKGWLLRAGFGVGVAELSGVAFGKTITISDDGGSFGFGAGHEWRLTRTFALGVAADYCTVDLDEDKFDFLNFTAQFNWYF